jgi:hypothetical protein
MIILKKPPKIIKRINSAIPLPSLPQVFFKLVEACKDASNTDKDIANSGRITCNSHKGEDTILRISLRVSDYDGP